MLGKFNKSEKCMYTIGCNIVTIAPMKQELVYVMISTIKYDNMEFHVLILFLPVAVEVIYSNVNLTFDYNCLKERVEF